MRTIKGEMFYLFYYSGARLGPFMWPDASIVCMMTRVHYIASDIVLNKIVQRHIYVGRSG